MVSPDAAADAAAEGDPIERMQPAEPIDVDNVVDYGEELHELELPPPPRSGFRLVVPPRTLDPGVERRTCVAWPLPAMRRHIVYAARLYTTPGLHHSNVIATPVDPDLGPQPFPDCRPDASDPYEHLDEDVVPDVLFANSTQVEGAETVVFPAGHGFRLDPSREVITSLHLLNPSDEPQRVEIAYDFFTMPEESLTDEIAPFVVNVDHFSVGVGETEEVGGACDVFGGAIATLMPHTHQYATDFTVEALAGGAVVDVLYDGGAYDLESDIQVFEPPRSLEGVDQIAVRCTFANTSDHPLVRGIGDNEMCILFGYVTPPSAQFFGDIPLTGRSCLSVPLAQDP